MNFAHPQIPNVFTSFAPAEVRLGRRRLRYDGRRAVRVGRALDKSPISARHLAIFRNASPSMLLWVDFESI